MGLHFQLDISFDIKDDVEESIILGLENLTSGLSLTENQRKKIPSILTYLNPKMTDNSFLGSSIFYFKKHYRFTQNNVDFYKYTFQLRQIFGDDEFYEEGYPLLAWFAKISDTQGFVGYYKEEYDEKPQLLYFRNSDVLFDDNPEQKFNLSNFNTEYS
jgi:hypothetical protein